MTTSNRRIIWLVVLLLSVTRAFGAYPAVARPHFEALAPTSGSFDDETLAYDDGTVRTWWCSDKDSFGVAVRFTPQQYPCDVVSALAVVHYDMASNIWLRAYDADGDSGKPGTLRANKLCTGIPHNADSSYRDYDLASPIEIDSGDFYLCLWQTAYFNVVFASDQQMNNMARQWWFFPAQGWVHPSGLDPADHLIRARVQYSSGVQEVIGSAQVPVPGPALTVNPNPVENGAGTLSYDLPAPGPARILVYDATGRPVLERSFASRRSSEIRLDLRDYANGLYFVRLEAAGSAVTRKLIKESH